MDYKEIGRKVLYLLFDPLVSLLSSIGIRPNHITIAGLVLNVIAAAYLLNYFDALSLSYGQQLLGFGLILGFAGLMDTLDGRLARKYELKSEFGAYFDSVIDRYSEFIMFIGMTAYFILFSNWLGTLACLVASMGSIMVSYNRSRAESIGVQCEVGLMQRPERIVFIGVWSIICGILFLVSQNGFQNKWQLLGVDLYTSGIVWLAFSTNITALRRLVFTRTQLLNRK